MLFCLLFLQSDLVIRNITICDPTQNQTQVSDVWISNGLIHRIGSNLSTPKNAEIQDGSGLFLLPALSDMHVHDGGPAVMGLNVAHGIMLIRAMGGEARAFTHYKQKIKDGSMIGPEIVSSDFIFESRRWLNALRNVLDHDIHHRVPYASSFEAHQYVNMAKDLGVDFIKIRNVPNLDALTGLFQAAKAQDLKVAGHDPFPSLKEGVGLGLMSVEHVPFFSMEPIGPLKYEESRELIKHFLDHKTMFTPTFVAMRNRRGTIEDMKHVLNQEDSRLKWLSEKTYKKWQDQITEREVEGSNLDWPTMLDRGEALFREMVAAGVPLCTGTDFGVLGLFPGLALHEELDLITQVPQLPAKEVLKMSTWNGPVLAGLSDEMGKIKTGYKANFLVLKKHPYKDIRHSQAIAAIVHQGRWFDEENRQKLIHHAIENKEEYVQEKHDSDWSHSQKAKFYTLKGDYHKAIFFFDLALRKEANKANQIGLFLAYLNDLNTKEAIVPFQHAVDVLKVFWEDLQPKEKLDMANQMLLVSPQAQKNALEPMIEDLLQNPDLKQGSSLMRLQATYYAGIDNAKALAARMALMPDYWQNHSNQLNNLAWWCFENQVELERARNWANKAIELSEEPRNKANAMDTLAEIENALGFPRKAYEIMLKANQISPSPYFDRQVQRFKSLLEDP